MVFAEATSVLPLIASDAYHRQRWKIEIEKIFPKLLYKTYYDLPQIKESF